MLFSFYALSVRISDKDWKVVHLVILGVSRMNYSVNNTVYLWIRMIILWNKIIIINTDTSNLLFVLDVGSKPE